MNPGAPFLFTAARVLLLAALLAACATSPDAVDPDPGATAASDLLQEAIQASQTGDLETCWARTREIAERHLESPQEPDALKLAAFCHRKLYKRDRLVDPYHRESRYLTTERIFLFEWLGRHFEADGAYPEDTVNGVLVNYPYRVFKEFREWGAARPEIARFDMRAKIDNGLVEYVTIEPDPTARY